MTMTIDATPSRLVRMIEAPLTMGISISGAAEHHSLISRLFHRMIEAVFGIKPTRHIGFGQFSEREESACMLMTLLRNVQANHLTTRDSAITFQLRNPTNPHDLRNCKLINVEENGRMKVRLTDEHGNTFPGFKDLPGPISKLHQIATHDKYWAVDMHS